MQDSSRSPKRTLLGGLIAIALAIAAVLPATAAAAAPTLVENPTVAPMTPHLGTTVAGTNGKWTGEPTFTYYWTRDGSMISGATEPSYTVGEADIGHKLTFHVTAKNSEGEAGASKTTNYITARLAACRSVGIGAEYEDSACMFGAGGSAGYSWYWWPSGGTTTVTGLSHVISWQWSGTAFGVSCSGAEGTAGISEKIITAMENSLLPYMAKVNITLTGCSVTAPAGKGCKVAGEKIALNTMEGNSISVGSDPKIELKPKAEFGGSLGAVKFEGCVPTFLNETFGMTGASLYATLGNAERKLALVQNTLTMQGYPAKFEGASYLTDSTGARVALRP